MNLLHFLPRFRDAEQAQEKLAERECQSREQIEAFQLAKINELWHDSVRFVPHYRELSKIRRLPERFETLEEYRATVPILSKTIVKANPQAFLSDRAARGRWYHTSGSTVIPMAVYWSDESHRQVLWAKYRFQNLWGINVFDRSVFLWGRAATGTLLQQHLEDWARGRLRLSVHDLGEQALQENLRKIACFRPAAIYGFSQAAYLLAQLAAKQSFDCPSLKVCIVSSEPAYPRMRAAISAGLKVPAVVEYGATECALIAYQHPDGTVRVREDLVMLETIPRVDGRFDIVLTVLANPSFPLLRYSIGDVTDATLSTTRPGFGTIGNIDGRNDDVLVTKGGRILHPTSLDRVFEGTRYPSVQSYQIHQDARGALFVNVILNSNSLDSKRMAREFEALLEGYPVHVAVVEQFLPTAGGKHRAIRSELAVKSNDLEAEQVSSSTV